MQLYFFVLYFFTYGFFGWCTEVAYAAIKQRRFVNRGFLNGPICSIYGVGVGLVVQLLKPFEENLLFLYLTSTMLVTFIEWLTGFLMDKLFHHKWWDYSDQPLNIGGYVCLLFSLVWGFACVVIVKVIHPLIHKALVLIPVIVGIVLIVMLGVVLFADLYVTVSGILKLNRKLEAMEKIAAELRELSDKVGENIYENVMETMEKQEEGKKLLEEVVVEGRKVLETATAESRKKFEKVTAASRRRLEEVTVESRKKLEEAVAGGRKKLEERIGQLQTKYNEMAAQSTKVSRRLLRAFPKMQSRRHKEILEELKAKIKNRR